MKSFRAGFQIAIAGLMLSAGGALSMQGQSFDRPVAGGSIQSGSAEETGSVGSVIRNLASRAGVVFVGQVESVQANGGVMEVVFAVQKPVIGDVGETYTVREWAGRWTGGQQHYRVGQRAMMFLYAPNEAGLSSPVEGMAGVVPLVPMGADADALLDVRWLATKVVRPVGSRIADADTGAVALSEAMAIVRGDGQEGPREPVRRPLPVGLRPRPVKTSNDTQENVSGELPILHVGGDSNVEH
jgi:hypothetical protein